MHGGRILIAQLVAAALLALFTSIAVAHSLYWRLWWFDIPMHMLGGAWAGLCAAWLLARRGNAFALVWCLVFAFLVGVAWEVFEYVEGIAVIYENYVTDTTIDLVMDLVGAAVGYTLANVLFEGRRWALRE